MLVSKKCSFYATSVPSRRSAMAHKLDLGFQHYNLQQTSPEALSSRRPRGWLSTELLTTQCGGVTVRALPTGDAADAPGSDRPAVDEELLLAYGGQGSSVPGSTQPPQEAMGGSSRSALDRSSQGGSCDKELLNAHWYPTMPKGPEAHNAAHCEPVPGDWPDPAPGVRMSEKGEGVSQHNASTPADDPQEIKDVVRHETLADHPEGEVA